MSVRSSSYAEQDNTGVQPEGPSTEGQTGSVLFPELVRAHYEWERAGCGPGESEERYRAKLQRFQEQEGSVLHAYWATRRPSAVALTVKPSNWWVRFIADNDATIRLHRVTDWLAQESKIADLLHHCDILAIKVSEVLRGTTERIAMQWIYVVQSHLLGYIERTRGKVDRKSLDAFIRSQSEEIKEIERYYTRAGVKAARIVYFWGMMIGFAIAGVIGIALISFLWLSGWFDQPHTRSVEMLFVCFFAGGLGAVFSVLMRMSSNRFRVDFEVGRSTIRRLGSFRPLIGVVFGVATYFLFLSDLFQTKVPNEESTAFFFFGSVAFLAGFNERWTNVLFGKAERTVAVSMGDPVAKAEQEHDA